MKSFKNDSELMLKQKIIHLGSEVKRLTDEFEKIKDRSYVKKLELDKETLLEKIASLEASLNTMEQHLIEERQESQVTQEQLKKLEGETEKYKKDLTLYQKEISKQSSVNVALEKEYDMVKDTVKDLIKKIEVSTAEQGGYKKIAEINEQLERENQEYKKEVTRLNECMIKLEEKNNIQSEEIERLKGSKSQLDVNNQQFFQNTQATVVSEVEGKASVIEQGEPSPAEATANASPAEDIRVQSWFYNNVKKKT